MATPLALRATERTIVGKKNRTLRATAVIPGVVYGHGQATQLVALPRGAFQKVFGAAGESSLVDLHVDDAPVRKVLIHDVQHDPLTGEPMHVDFYLVNMAEKLTAEVPLIFVGESPAVKELGGVLVRALDHVKVECLPQDLIHELSVDLSTLKTFDDVIRVSDLTAPTGVTILAHRDEVVTKVQAPRAEEEAVKVEAAPEAEAVAAVEVGAKKKETGEDAEA